MRKELLDLVPTEYLCPYCGQWHEWKDEYALKEASYAARLFAYDCPNSLLEEIIAKRIFFELDFRKEKLLYNFYVILHSAFKEDCEIPIDEIKEDPLEPIVWINLDLSSLEMCDLDKFCYYYNICPMTKETYKRKFVIALKFNEDEFVRAK